MYLSLLVRMKSPNLLPIFSVEGNEWDGSLMPLYFFPDEDLYCEESFMGYFSIF